MESWSGRPVAAISTRVGSAAGSFTPPIYAVLFVVGLEALQRVVADPEPDERARVIHRRRRAGPLHEVHAVVRDPAARHRADVSPAVADAEGARPACLVGLFEAGEGGVGGPGLRGPGVAAVVGVGGLLAVAQLEIGLGPRRRSADREAEELRHPYRGLDPGLGHVEGELLSIEVTVVGRVVSVVEERVLLRIAGPDAKHREQPQPTPDSPVRTGADLLHADVGIAAILDGGL